MTDQLSQDATYDVKRINMLVNTWHRRNHLRTLLIKLDVVVRNEYHMKPTIMRRLTVVAVNDPYTPIIAETEVLW